MEGEILITMSDVLEYLFCPRFIYFMYALDIPQNEEKYFKVLKGREIHKVKKDTNKEYLRKKLGVVRKESEVYLVSDENNIKGIVDEVLFFADGTAGPLEYKFAEYKEKVFSTYRTQLILQGILIRDNYGVDVERGYLCYSRSNSKIVEITFTKKDFDRSLETVNEIIQIIQKGFYPKETRYKAKCMDCTYRNICN